MWVVIAIRLEHQWLKTSVRTTQFKLVDSFTSHTHTYKLTHTTRIYTYSRTYTHTHVHTYTHTYIHTYIHTYTHMYIYTHASCTIYSSSLTSVALAVFIHNGLGPSPTHPSEGGTICFKKAEF